MLTTTDLDRRRAAKHAAGHPPEARYVELIDGERIEGVVVRLPMWSAESGTRLFITTNGETVAIPATKAKGHTVLARLLEEQRVAVGDQVTIIFAGKRRTADGEREYGDYRLEARHAR
jgi:hypothetical protein